MFKPLHSESVDNCFKDEFHNVKSACPKAKTNMTPMTADATNVCTALCAKVQAPMFILHKCFKLFI